MGQIFISVWQISTCGTRGENYPTLDANYSINHNSKVLIEDILDVDMCLRKQNLKKIANLLKNKGVRAIFIKGVFNKKLQICSNILRNYMICCVYVCMYGYEMVCISMHEYWLAPSKVWIVPQPPAGARTRRA